MHRNFHVANANNANDYSDELTLSFDIPFHMCTMLTLPTVDLL